MSRRIRRPRIVLALCAPALVAGAAAAQPVTVGAPTEANCLPFGCGGPALTRYQQVYDAGAFAGPLSIGQVSFFSLGGTSGAGSFVPGTYAFRLATTTLGAGELTADLDANATGPFFPFATLTLSGTVPETFTVAGGPFAYDPAAGSLLLDVLVDGGFTSNGARFEADATVGPLQRAYVSDGTAYVSDDYGGLVTRFDVAPATVPEPSAGALVATGLAGVAGLAGLTGRARSRRRARR